MSKKDHLSIKIWTNDTRLVLSKLFQIRIQMTFTLLYTDINSQCAYNRVVIIQTIPLIFSIQHYYRTEPYFVQTVKYLTF